MDYKHMCIQQGYIPSTCQMDGQMAWLLVKDGKNPCDGCNHRRDICHGKEKSYDNMDSFEKTMFFFDRIEEKQKERNLEEYKKKQEQINKRKESHADTKIYRLMKITLEHNCRNEYFEINIKDIMQERAYTAKFDIAYDLINYGVHYTQKFQIQQIHIDCGGATIMIYEDLLNKCKEHNILTDIVPFTYHPLKDSTIIDIYEQKSQSNGEIVNYFKF